MKILIAGGTGFIGQSLAMHFLQQGHELIILGRDKEKIRRIYAQNNIQALTWNELEEQDENLLRSISFIFNLTGANIAGKKWSEKRKKEILDSRILTTEKLAMLCAHLVANPPALFNASAVGIYGLQKPVTTSLPKPFDEKESLNNDHAVDFLSKIGKAWEKATQPAMAQGVRVINMRFAVVLAKKGLLSKLYPTFKMGLGTIIGSGNQPFSFIALDDLIRAIDFLMERPEIRGPVNFVAPQCISQRELASTLARTLHRPCFLHTPSFVFKFLFGEMADELLLNGQCAYPEVLLSNGFQFKYPTITDTLKHIYDS